MDTSSIEAIRALVSKAKTAFQAQNAELTRLQNLALEDVKPEDRNALDAWNPSLAVACNSQLEALERLPEPTVEEKTLMQELNKVVNLGDHVLERRGLVMSLRLGKYGEVDMRAAKLPEGDERVVLPNGKVVIRRRKPSAKTAETESSTPTPTSQASADVLVAAVEAPVRKARDWDRPSEYLDMRSPTTHPCHVPPGDRPPQFSPHVYTVEQSAVPSDTARTASPQSAGPEGEGSLVISDALAPLGPVSSGTQPSKPFAPGKTNGTGGAGENLSLYSLLGVPHDADQWTIKRAIKIKSAKYHPDHTANQKDESAGEKFADFKAMVAVLDDPETRRVYDERGDVEELAKKVRSLTL